MKTILTVDLTCPRCNFTKIIKIDLDEDGVYSIPNKFCPNDMHVLSREVLADIPGPKVIDEPEQDKTPVKNTIPGRPGAIQGIKDRISDSEKAAS